MPISCGPNWYISITVLLLSEPPESEKAGLKFNVKTKIIPSSTITSWQTEWEKVKSVPDFPSLGSKITTDGNCSHDIRRQLLPGRKAMTKLDSVLKNKCHFAGKGPYVQSYGISISHVRIESWTIKKEDHQRIDAFKLWC